MASATLLLPARAQLAGDLPAQAGKALARADRDQDEAGERAQLRRHFRLVPDHWPVAALTRQPMPAMPPRRAGCAPTLPSWRRT